jgi:hypothetical protein
VLGRLTITAVGTLVGTAVHGTTTTDGYPGTVTTTEFGNDETNLAGTTTGDDQYVGTNTVVEIVGT